MKKIISLILGIILLTACGKVEEFTLKYQNKELFLNKTFTKENYGEYKDFFESENCAFGDKDITYIYDDLEIETYGNKNGDLIVYSIYFTGDAIKTSEGISLYDEIEDAIKVYGNDYKKDGNKYTYTKGNTDLIFITDNNIINSIEYRLNNLK